MRLRRYLVNEASFSNSNLERVVNLLLKVVGKSVGALYPFGGKGNNFDRFNKANGNKGIGMLYVMDDGRLVRFNWESNKKSSTITSIDVWKDMRTDKPIKTLVIPPDYNIVKSVDTISKFIKNPGGTISEAKYGAQRIADAEKYGIPVDLPTPEFRKRLTAAWKEAGEPTSKAARIKAGLMTEPGSKETSTRSQETEKAEKTFASKKYADADVVFNDLDDLVTMVAKGIQPSLLVTGSPGLGKTYSVTKKVTEVVGSKGKDWVIVKGKSSPMGLYLSLFLNRDKLIVFDDMDSVFSNSDTVNLIKASVDSYDEREISWISPTTQNLSGLSDSELKVKFAEIEDAFTTGNPDAGKKELKLPASFIFTGRIIFISNIHESKLDSAIKSRSFVIDITLRSEDVLNRMESILDEISPNTDMSIKKDVLDFLRNSPELRDGVNLRTLLNGIKCKASGSPRWQHLVKNYA